MLSTKVIITGLKSIDRKLKTLPLRVQKKVVRQSIRAGLKVMAADVKAEAPVDSGAMKGAVKVRAAKRRKRGTIELEVVIRGDERLIKTSSAGKRTFYPAVVTYGSKKRNIRADNFMRRSYKKKGNAVRRIVIDRLRAGIEREARGSA